MSRSHRPAPSLPATPADPADQAGLSRRDRRAAARGGAAAKVPGPPAARRVAVPDRQRNFAARRRG